MAPLERELGPLIQELYFEPKLARIWLGFQDSTKLYVRYNDHEEYSYSLMFSLSQISVVQDLIIIMIDGMS